MKPASEAWEKWARVMCAERGIVGEQFNLVVETRCSARKLEDGTWTGGIAVTLAPKVPDENSEVWREN